MRRALVLVAVTVVAGTMLQGCQAVTSGARLEDDGTIAYNKDRYEDQFARNAVACPSLADAKAGTGKGCKTFAKGDAISVWGTTIDRSYVKVVIAPLTWGWVKSDALLLHPR
jgi:hypothetical protein